MDSLIVTAARTWIGTRFAHQGRRKKTANDSGGVDCLGLLIGIADELNLEDRHGQPLIDSDETDYSKLPDGWRLSNVLSTLLLSVPITEIRAGDIALFRIDGNPQHLGIISDHGIIHAYAPSRKVVEHCLDEEWKKKIVRLFRVP